MILDQQDIAISQQVALVPGAKLLDSRSEKERLAFLVEFAELINFYNQDNVLFGNWSPFLLKDAVFLLASIAHTDFQHHVTLFEESCRKLQAIIEDSAPTPEAFQSIGPRFNLLFGQIIEIFVKIETWTSYLVQYKASFHLKTYILQQVEHTYSPIFWAFVSLNQQLHASQQIAGIEQIPPSILVSFDEKIWQTNKGKQPYWQVLHMQGPVKERTTYEVFQTVEAVGEIILQFFTQIIEYAPDQFLELQDSQYGFPDTDLLRVFVRLLQVQQEQLNGLATKHLQFYYEDILIQQPRAAQPDHVLLSLALAKPDATFELPSFSQFYAGLDQQKRPILFQNLQAISLNPAKIASTQALILTEIEDQPSYQLITIPEAGTVKKSEQGQVQSWGTVIDAALTKLKEAESTTPNLGFAIASPMLLMEEGVRTLEVDLSFSIAIEMQFLLGASYFLSTAKKWFSVKLTSSSLADGDDQASKTIKLQFDLTAADPAIQAFTKHPDGLESTWPMFKVSFNKLPEPAHPPVLTAVSLSIAVRGYKNFKLYNDHGALQTTKPFQLFGPLAAVNSGFMVGSAEIFSKAFSFLNIEIDWDNLPGDFMEYYLFYNGFVHEYFDEVVSKFSSDTPPPNPTDTTPFNNTAFQVHFSVLTGGVWEAFSMKKKESCTYEKGKFSCTSYTGGSGCEAPPTSTNSKETYELLFSTIDDSSLTGLISCDLEPSSCFSYSEASSTFIPQPNLQLTPLKFTPTTKDGFFKMQLGTPAQGFGKELYPQVVSAISLANSRAIIKKDIPILETANPPYVPKVSSFTGNYAATQQYDLTQKDASYPLQFFVYDPIQNHKVYDNTENSDQATSQTETTSIPTSTTQTDSKTAETGIPLQTPNPYAANLLIELEQLIAPSAIHFYIQLATSAKQNIYQTAPIVTFHYLNKAGWQPLQVIADGTQNLMCSGILSLQIPVDITTDHPSMPGDNYWISIAADQDLEPIRQILLLAPNGLSVQRTEVGLQPAGIPPSIPAKAITKPMPAIPQIASIHQPFPSFGGKAAEDQAEMNQRVSTRIRTKDRVLTQGDFFNLIAQAYPEIYYSKTFFNKSEKRTEIYLAKSVANVLEANAFLPAVSRCQELEIEHFLQARASSFANILVSSFLFEYVTVSATIGVAKGYDPDGVLQLVNEQVKSFLSPWISEVNEHITIDRGIQVSQIAGFIKSCEGVAQLDSLDLSTHIQTSTGTQAVAEDQTQDIQPLSPAYLFVPAITQKITLTNN